MNFNFNSGYGQGLLATLPQTFGKILVVAGSAVAQKDMLRDIFVPDPDGKIRFYETVDQAIGACTANQGDIILVAPGHTETVTSTSIALDVAGVEVICLGHGDKRATFTFSTAAATITVTGANTKWKGGKFVANFLNVASAFTIGAAKNVTIEDVRFIDSSSVLNFLSAVVTGSTNNEADGLKVLNNYAYRLATSENAFVSILANELFITISGNEVYSSATNDAGHFITLSSKLINGSKISDNILVVVGATTATVGIFLTGSGTTSTGIVKGNLVSSLDTTAELIATAGTGLKYFENYYTGTADASGKLWPVVDAA